MKDSRGFTLIELIVVIVILGLLAATALPKFIDISVDAKNAAIKGVAGALSSASTINYSARKVNSANGVTVTSCQNISLTMQPGAFPAADWSILPSAAISANTTTICTVVAQSAGQYNGASTQTFIAYGIT